MSKLSPFLFISLFTLLSLGCAHDLSQFQGKTQDEKIQDFFQWSFDKQIEQSPMELAQLGIEKRQGDLDDLSEEQAQKSQAMTKEHLDILHAFDRDQLSPANQLNYDLYQFYAQRSLDGFQWRHYGYLVNQMFGLHSGVAGFMINTHKVDNEEDLKNYIARLEKFKLFFDQLVNQLMRSEAVGVVPPQFVFPLTIGDSKNLVSGNPFEKSKKDSPLYADFKEKLSSLKLSKDKRASYLKQAESALKTSVEPGYKKLIAFLESQSKRATTDDGVWKFAKGEEYYKQRLKLSTTTDMTPDQIHQVGLDQVARIHSEMMEIAKKMGIKGDLQQLFKHMRGKQYIYPNNKKGKQAYLNKAKRLIATMKKSLPRFFKTLPKADIKVKAVEPYREKSAGMAFYQSPSLDGKRPGVYYVNLYNMAALPKWEAEALAYHEGVPGHHLQLSIANELESVPMFRRVAHVTAYVEGWGLYSERFPEEQGFYADPASDFGRLSMELVRACRLVVDTGIHHKKWTREKAIKYLDNNLPGDHADNVRQIQRYIVMPGQATAYMIGQLKILQLRAKAEKELGKAFQLGEFHDVILTGGAVPLSILQDQVDAFIKQKQATL